MLENHKNSFVLFHPGLTFWKILTLNHHFLQVLSCMQLSFLPGKRYPYLQKIYTADHIFHKYILHQHYFRLKNLYFSVPLIFQSFHFVFLLKTHKNHPDYHYLQLQFYQCTYTPNTPLQVFWPVGYPCSSK